MRKTKARARRAGKTAKKVVKKAAATAAIVNTTPLRPILRELGACEESREWVGDRDIATAYAECERADWLLWLFGMMADKPGWSKRNDVILAACACTESTLGNLPKDEDRPRQAIETVRAWIRGEATREQLDAAAASAAWSAARSAESAAWSAESAAASAASAARSAESAARSAESAAESAARSAESAARSAARSAESAARSAAWSAESAARSAAWSAESAARSAHHKKLCDIIRSMLPCPQVPA